MPKARSGSKLWNKAHTLCSVRVRLPGVPGRLSFAMPNSSGSEAEADDRVVVVNDVAQRMTSIELPLAKLLLADIAAAPQAKLGAACKGADAYIGGYRPPSAAPTVKELGKDWTDLKLYAKHRVDFKKKMKPRSAAHTDELLCKWVYPELGHVPVDQITLDAADRLKVVLSKSNLEHNSARNVLARFRALLNIAVYPCKYIDRSPLPKGWVPAATASKAKAMIYPDDDAQLLRCAAVSIHWRMFWGFFGHEGMRPHNVVALKLSNVDLDRNSVTVDKSKTDARIMFAMTPGTREAVREYLRRYRPNAKPDDYLFVDDDGGPIPLSRLAPIAREHFELAGVLARRPELEIDDDDRRQLVAYDYRGAFITIKLAARWTPAQVQEHTAHVDTRMFQTYQRAAETFEHLELRARDFVPLIAAIPELQTSPDGNGSDPTQGQSFGQSLATRSANHALSLTSDKFSQDFLCYRQGADMPKLPKKLSSLHPSSPTQQGTNGQSQANAEALANDEYVRRLELELEVERRVSVRMQAALADVHLQLVPAMTAAVQAELARNGITERARPKLVLADDGERDDGDKG